MKKKNIDYEELPNLTVEDFKNRKLQTEIVRIPKTVKTQYVDDQPVIGVKVGIETKNWWANWTSMNALIDKWGTDENKMLHKTIDLVLVKQPVDGIMKDIIYLKDSYKEPEKKG